MKKTAIFLTFTLFLLIMASCSENTKKDKDAQNIEFSTYSYQALAQLPDSLAVDVEGGAFCHLKGQGVLPEKIGDNDIFSLRDSLINLANIIMVEKGYVQPVIENDMTLCQENPNDSSACGLSVNELSIDMVTPQLIVWKDYNYNYICGAAHGMFSTTYVNYSIIDNKIFKLSDLFRPDYEGDLKELIRQKLSAENVTLLVPLDEVGIPDDFRITTHTLEFIYSLYEIAPYSEGEVTVEIDRYELESLFKENIESLLFGESF